MAQGHAVGPDGPIYGDGHDGNLYALDPTLEQHDGWVVIGGVRIPVNHGAS